MVDSHLRDLAVGIARHGFIQDAPKIRIELFVVQMNEDVSLSMSDVKGAHRRIMPLFAVDRQEIEARVQQIGILR